MGVFENIISLNEKLPKHVKLIAVSKFHSVDRINEAYRAGARFFGESRMQELIEKKNKLPADIRWHFIGHLQRNKVREVVSLADTIESVDSERLLSEILKQSDSLKKRVRCFLQIHISNEDTKYGFSYEECEAILKKYISANSEYCCIGGLMGMASNTDDMQEVRKEFGRLKEFYEYIKETYFKTDDDFSDLSMGMSGDYTIAIEEGSTMVRLGSIIFGNREY